MSDDYTPGHAYNDIRAIIGEAPGDADAIAPILTLLYKAGHANERAAIVALIRQRKTLSAPSAAAVLEGVAIQIERGEI